MLDFYLIIINNNCESLKVAVFKALHAAISAKEEAQSKRLIEAIELNKSFISHLVQSLQVGESLYSLKWNLIALLAVNFASKNVQNFIFFETQFFSILHFYLDGQMKELELHCYLVENIKSLCFSEQFLDKVSQTFSWVLLKNLFKNLQRFLSEGFSKIVLSYAQIFLLLKTTTPMREFLKDDKIFSQLMFSFLNPQCSLDIQVIFLKLMMVCVNKEISFVSYLDSKYTLFNSGFLCKTGEKHDAINKIMGKPKQNLENFSPNQKSVKRTSSVVKRTFKLGSLLTDCFENALKIADPVAIERCLILFGHCIDVKCIFTFLRQKHGLLENLSDEYPQKVQFLLKKIRN